MRITSMASVTVLAVVLLGVGFGPALNDVLAPPLPGEHRANVVEILSTPDKVDNHTCDANSCVTTYSTDSLPTPSETERAADNVGMVHDPDSGVSLVYVNTLPACDSDDGTPVSSGKLVHACKWDGGENSYIVVAP